MSDNYLSFNNTACPGCGQILAARAAVNALAPHVIVINATGCLEITTTRWPDSAWGVPWLHSLFSNAAPTASGVAAALKQRGDQLTKILVQAGDGATFDIGFGAVSALWQRNEPIIYICYDNEVYANTGLQASGATAIGALTATTPQGQSRPKKDLLAIALAHQVPYVAQTTSAHLDDLTNKVKAAAAVNGASYIQVLSACIPGWGVSVKDSVAAARLAAETGLYPLLEFRDGREVGGWHVPRPTPPVSEYLKTQRRYQHLLTAEKAAELRLWQQQARDNIKRYKL